MTTTATAGPSANAVREGVRRGVRELHQMVTNRQDLVGNLIWLFGMLAPSTSCATTNSRTPPCRSPASSCPAS